MKYMVKQGDTMYQIAQMHGVTLQSMIAANPHIPDPNKLEIGMQLHVPAAGGIPGAGSSTYIVKSGDTLWKISKKTGYSLAHIIAANPQITNPDVLTPGQLIQIPGHDVTGMPMTPIPLHSKEKMMMPKEKAVQKAVPVPAPTVLPAAPLTAPIQVTPVMPPHVDVKMIDYHPHYVTQPPMHVHVKKEVKMAPKPKAMPKELPKAMPKELPKAMPKVLPKAMPKALPKAMPKPAPAPVVSPIMAVPAPVPIPMPYPVPAPMLCDPCNPCPPGMVPMLVDECGNLHPHPMYPYHYNYPAMQPYHAGMYHYGMRQMYGEELYDPAMQMTMEDDMAPYMMPMDMQQLDDTAFGYGEYPGLADQQQPGMMQPGMMQPGMMQPGMMQPGMMQPGMMQPGMMQPGMMQPGMMQPGMMQPGMMQPEMMQPGMMQPEMMQPGMMQPGMMQPGMMQQLPQTRKDTPPKSG